MSTAEVFGRNRSLFLAELRNHPLSLRLYVDGRQAELVAVTPTAVTRRLLLLRLARHFLLIKTLCLLIGVAIISCVIPFGRCRICQIAPRQPFLGECLEGSRRDPAFHTFALRPTFHFQSLALPLSFSLVGMAGVGDLLLVRVLVNLLEITFDEYGLILPSWILRLTFVVVYILSIPRGIWHDLEDGEALVPALDDSGQQVRLRRLGTVGVSGADLVGQ